MVAKYAKMPAPISARANMPFSAKLTSKATCTFFSLNIFIGPAVFSTV